MSSKQQQTQGFKLQSEQQLSGSQTNRSLNQNSTHQQSAPLTSNMPKNKHLYLEEQYTYGRFVPFLLLKDRLHSQLDNSGHTALHHMCSHNSEYLPLYLSDLKNHDPILNRPSKVGHTPLDVAGIYCRKQYVDLLIEKGAVDKGNVDHWAIQGGNIYNWTGNVDITKKHLIHWAAYNDMPDVLWEFYRRGAEMNQKDGNDCTPMDLAVINKSYKAVQALSEMGFMPKQQNLKNCDSKSIERILAAHKQSKTSKQNKTTSKLIFVPLFTLMSIFATGLTANQDQTGFRIQYLFNFSVLALWIALVHFVRVQPQPVYANTRKTSFHSDIIGSEVNPKSNHKLYTLLSLLIFLQGFIALFSMNTIGYVYSIIYFVICYVTIVFLVNTLLMAISIGKNLSHQEMYNRNQCKYGWRETKYIQQRKMVIKTFSNPLDRGIKENFSRYFKR